LFDILSIGNNLVSDITIKFFTAVQHFVLLQRVWNTTLDFLIITMKMMLTLFNTGTQQISFTVVASGIDYIQSGTLSANEQKTVNISSEAEVSSIDDQSKGIYLTTTGDDLIAIGQSIKGVEFDTFTLQPITSLNVDKYTYYSISPSSVNSDISSILVVGTADSTIIELTVTQAVKVKIGDSINNLVPGILNSFVINRFQTMYISSETDLSGSKIVTDRPVSVFSGDRNGKIEGWPRRCYMAEQIPPTAY